MREWIWMALLAGTPALAMDGDVTTDHEYTVFLEGNNNNCTGVLITPGVVLTAAHCTTQHYADNSASGSPGSKRWKVSFDTDASTFTRASRCNPNLSGWSPPEGCSNDVRSFKSSIDLVALPGHGDTESDVALILLNKLVSNDVLPPPMLGNPTCDPYNAFKATQIGYGKPTPPYRRYRVNTGFERDLNGGVGIYDQSGLFDPDYDDMNKGDSGGPLVQEVAGVRKLCGVASRALPGLVPGTWVQEYAAVDSPDVVAWMKSELQLGDGTLLGDCASAPGSTNDADGDLIPDECDLCPNTPADLSNLSQVNLDSDHDGVGDQCDVCPGGDDTVDKDEDGCPDFFACDPCVGPAPLEPGYIPHVGDTCGDRDLDGVCDYDDNCLSTPNPDQHNANDLAEDVRKASSWGDICDPVLATDTAIQPRFLDVATRTGTYFIEDIDLVYRNEIALRGLSSSPSPSSSATSPSSFIDVTNELRYCQPDATALKDCTNPLYVNDSWLTTAASAASEGATDPWHRITLKDGTRGATIKLPHTSAHPKTVTWDYKSDEEYWRTTLGAAIPLGDTEAPWGHADASGLDGVLWVHTVSSIGSTYDTGTGLHGTGLHNHYVDLAPASLKRYIGTKALSRIKTRPDLLYLPDPPPWRDVFNFQVLVLDEEGVVGPLTGGGLVGVVDESALSEVALESMFYADEDDTVWWNAVDGFRAPSDAPMAVALLDDASAVVDALMPLEDGGWDLASERGEELGNADPEGLARWGAAVAYHAGLGGLWIASGEGSELPGIVRVGLGEESGWTELPMDVELYGPLAMGVTAGKVELWVLDTDGEHMRLVRVDGARGGGEVVYEEAISSERQWWMRLDARNRLVLVGSGSKGTVVAAITPGERPTITGFTELDAELSFAPVMTPSGLMLVSGEGEVQVQVLQELPAEEMSLEGLKDWL